MKYSFQINSVGVGCIGLLSCSSSFCFDGVELTLVGCLVTVVPPSLTPYETPPDQDTVPQEAELEPLEAGAEEDVPPEAEEGELGLDGDGLGFDGEESGT